MFGFDQISEKMCKNKLKSFDCLGFEIYVTMPECITHTLAVSPMNFSGGRLYECICVKATYNIKVIVTVIYKVHSTIKATT